VLANGRPVHNSEGVWRFATTPPVPPYLFVVCAGPWASVTWEHRGLPFGWHARRSLAGELHRDADELKATTQACFDRYCDMFDEPYAFDSYDQVFVPGLNWGAMEMPGCITFRDELLPRGRISDHDRLRRGTIIAHEMAHMWFGDLVTMRWWEDTWLSESFADYMGFRIGEEAAGFSGAAVSFEAQRKPGGYDADERRSTHSVAARTDDLVDVDTAFGNFDAISYAKGNSVLRQLVTWIGDQPFLAGVNSYLTRHRLGNASLADFVAALASESDRDVPAWVESWLRTTGFDTIRVSQDGDVPVLTREGSRPHRISVRAYDGSLVEWGVTMVDLAEEPVRLESWAGLMVVPNSHGETFARIRLDDDGWRVVEAHLAEIRDPMVRAVLWSSAFDLVHCGELTPEGFLTLVTRQLPQEHDVAIVEAVVDRTLGPIVRRHVRAEEAATALDTLAAACSAGLGHQPPQQLALALTRALARSSRDSDLLHSWLTDDRTDEGVDLDPELRWQVVHRLIETGGADLALVDAEARRDTSVVGELGAATARSALPDRAAKDAAWSAMMEDERVSNRMFEALATGLWSPEQAPLLAPYVARYFAEAPTVAERRGQAFSQGVGRAFPGLRLSDEQVALLDAALAGDVPTVLRRSWEDSHDEVMRARDSQAR
jgi:aminopeptidase N